MVLGNVFSGIFAYSYKLYGEDNGVSDYLLSWAASIGSGFINGSARVVMGYLQDRFSFKLLLAILFIIWTVIAATMTFIVKIPWLYFILVLLNYFATGGIFALFPGSVNNCFGMTYAPQIYSLILLGSFCGSLINFILTNYVYGTWQSYFMLFMIGLASQVVSLIVLFFFEENLDV